MKTRWNANTWVLVVLLTLIGVVGFDIGHEYFKGGNASAAKITPPDPYPKFKVGDPAPDFILPDAKGKKHALSELVHKDTFLSFNCGCSNCRDMETYLAELQKRLGDKAPQFLTVTSMNAEREETWFRDTGLKQTILYTPHGDTSVMDLYKGHPCPRMFRVTADRKVAWIGPSMSLMPSLKAVGGEAAANLGFSTPAHKDPSKPLAPEMKTDALETPPVPPPMPGRPS
jgi:thiol-disulfide isomerase/thioredoxin